MIPQSSFMILAPITRSKETELRRLLASMNHAPGRVNAHNPVIPFHKLATMHFAGLLILDDLTTGDVSLYELPPETYPLYFAFLGDIDGDDEDFISELASSTSEGLRKLFSCCEGFSPDSNLVAWMKEHRSPSIANYINCRGRTVRQVHEEAYLVEKIQAYLSRNESSLVPLAPEQVHATLRVFVRDALSAGRIALSPDGVTPLRWWLLDKVHFIGIPLLLLLALPFLIVLAPFYVIGLRRLEKSDPELCDPVEESHVSALSLTENHDVTNQFSAMGSLKPGWLRLLTTVGVLSIVNWGARHLTRPGRLGRIRTIHFARWVFLNGRKRMIFCSNYDGSVESYMDDFINKAGFGLNASFSNGIGYPKTNWLVMDGCADERNYKEFLRRHTLQTQVWYKAYPGLTAIDLERNTLIRKGLEQDSMTEAEAGEWLALL